MAVIDLGSGKVNGNPSGAASGGYQPSKKIIDIESGEVQEIIDEGSQQEQFNQQTGGTAENQSGNIFTPQQVLPPVGDTSLATQIKSGFSDDQQNKIRMLAEARFPNDPKAVERYGIKDGKIVYMDDTGALREEEESITASILGASPPVIGAIVGGSLAGPVGAAVGGGFGESIRKLTGSFMGDEQTSLGNAKDIGVEGLLGYLGYKGGELLTNKMNARGGYKAVRPKEIAEARVLQEAATELDVPLDAAQLTNSARLKGTSHVLRMGTEDAADVYQAFDKLQDKKVVTAVMRWLDDISIVRDEVTAGTKMIKASDAAIKEAKGVRSAQSGPLYEAAKSDPTPIDTTDIVKLIDAELASAKGAQKTNLMKIRNLFFKTIEGSDGKPVKVLDDSVVGLHNAKINLDNMLGKSPANASALEKSNIYIASTIKEQLLTALEASPKYMRALEAHKAASPAVNNIVDGIVGVLSKLKPNQAGSVVTKLFGARTPNSIRQAKEIISRKDPALWDELHAAWLEGEFLAAGKSDVAGEVVNHGAKLAQRLTNPAVRAKIKASMSIEQFETFETLMKVLQATGRGAKGGSRTEFNRAAGEEMLQDAKPVAAQVIETVAIQNLPTRISDWWTKASLGEYATTLAKMMTSPNSLNSLKEITRLPPNSEKAYKLIATAMASVSNDAIDFGIDAVAPPRDRMPTR